ncbi:DUF3159 domain-containing protein, partial [Kineococcus sp. T13]|uniref:DUF3159 domain-containing protein n=1 Tax=Kineococcus vitellinus TaxID=2696565 RepID=UPI00141245BB|nr:DUF3159 domain-containing protein [Kineococcus vitellinus]
MLDPAPGETHRPQHARPGEDPARAGTGASARARRVLGLPDPVERSAGRATAHRTLERLGGPVGLAAAAAPTIAFVVADAVDGLGTAVAALAVTAVLACAVRLARHESPGAAVAGLVVAALCAALAALVGEARAFFLPTTLLPALFVAAHAVALLARRPLMGFLVNPLSGGPRDWRGHRALRRTYTASSVIGMLLAGGNLAARLTFYLQDEPAVLAALQIGVPALFAVHFALTLLAARRVVGGEEGEGEVDGEQRGDADLE